MKIAVVGVGGVGGFFGWRLLEAGEDVVFVARGETCRVLKEKGLTIETLEGDTVLRPVKAFEDPSEVGAVDAVLLAVKSWQVPEAAKAIRPMIGPQTFVLPLQNGVDSPFVVGAELGMEHVLGGLCYIVSFKLGPGHIGTRDWSLASSWRTRSFPKQADGPDERRVGRRRSKSGNPRRYSGGHVGKVSLHSFFERNLRGHESPCRSHSVDPRNQAHAHPNDRRNRLFGARQAHHAKTRYRRFRDGGG